MAAAFFETTYKEGKIQVEEHLVGNSNIYRVYFSDKRQPLNLTRAFTENASRFWTSIPEGRQQEAEEVGACIFAYITANN